MERAGRRFALISDAAGSVRQVLDSTSGEVVQELTYDTFGRVLSDTNPGFQPFGFSGGLYDPATSLVRLGTRDYDASTGRWTTKDPLLFDGRDTNVYAYAVGDPINFIDPTGLLILPADPQDLPPEWVHDPTCQAPNRVKFKHPSGDSLEFDMEQPGEPGWAGQDHWHHNGGKKHLRPGTWVPDPAPVCTAPSDDEQLEAAADDDQGGPKQRSSDEGCRTPYPRPIWLAPILSPPLPGFLPWRMPKLAPVISPASPPVFVPIAPPLLMIPVL
jgi:RHS repeat-associated protein